MTRDGGANWTPRIERIPGAPKGSWISRIEASLIDAGTAYVAIDDHRRGDMKPYLWRTRDFGDSWESLVAPNLEGYVWVVVEDRYEEQWQRVSALQRDFISRGEIGFLDDLEAAGLKLRTFADRVRRASYGHAGLFDAVKINEQELAQLYEYDLKMVDLGDEVARAIDHIELSIGSDGLPAAIRNLVTLAQQSIDVFNRRDEAILSNAQ